MNKKQFTIICVLLLIIIGLLVYLITKNQQFMTDFYNTGNYLSYKIDILTSKVNMLS